ncbi:MAG TPA: NlpC/P60 family protein [Terricaulis sp.]|nr:NlpC/P60 family protein [Terricaulis sp.]
MSGHLQFGAAFDLSRNAAAPLAAWAPPLFGAPFVDRAAGPDAFDCTGLVEWVAALLGRRVRSYSEIYASVDCDAAAKRDAIIRAEAEAWRPGAGDVGDVLILGTGRRAHHVAVLCGAGRAMHASRAAGGVAYAEIVGRKRVRRVASHDLYAVLTPT